MSTLKKLAISLFRPDKLQQAISFTLRPLIAAGVIFTSGLLAIISSQRINLLILVLVFGTFGAATLLRLPTLGLILLPFLTMIVPFSIGTGTGTSLHAALLLIVFMFVLWILDMLVRKKQFILNPSRTTLPVIVFVIISLLSFLNGQFRWLTVAQPASITAQVGGLAVFLVSFMLFLITSNQLTDLLWLRRLTWLFLILGAIYLLGRIRPEVAQYTFRIFQYGAFRSLFWVWITAFSVGLLLYEKPQTKTRRLLLIFILAATIHVGYVIDYDWKSGWLPPLVTLAAVIWIGSPRWRWPVTILVILLLFSYASGSDNSLATSEDYSLMTRLEAWRILLDVVKINPVFGLGFANYYWYTPYFPILGYSVQFNSHNNYVDIFAQTGILGLACFLWFGLEIGWSGWKMIARAPQGFARAYTISAMGGLVGTIFSAFLGDWFLPFVYNVGLDGTRSSLFGWMFLGGLVALDQIIPKQLTACKNTS